jgi:hypothetical protein
MDNDEISEAIFDDLLDIFEKYVKKHEDHKVIDGEESISDDAVDFILVSMVEASKTILESKRNHFNNDTPFSLN